MDVTYFRPRRQGPEAVLETAVATRLREVFTSIERPCWVAGSLPIGAGMPDLVLMTYRPEVLALANSEMPTNRVLAFLRSVTKAGLDTIVDGVGLQRAKIVRCLDDLVDAKVIRVGSDHFAVSGPWRQILPDIITIEAKVSKWRDAVDQAARNQIFAHQSFVALPMTVAERIRKERYFTSSGVGLLGVHSDDSVEILKCTRRRQPRVWTYYYQLATTVAKHLGKECSAIRSTNQRSKPTVP